MLAHMVECLRGRVDLIVVPRAREAGELAEVISKPRCFPRQQGTHDELVRTGGRYATLHRLQTGLHEIA